MKVFYVVDYGYYAAKDISDVEKALIGFHGEVYGKEAFEGCYQVTLETEMWVTKDFAIKMITSLQEAGATDVCLLRWDGSWWCREVI